MARHYANDAKGMLKKIDNHRRQARDLAKLAKAHERLAGMHYAKIRELKRKLYAIGWTEK